MINKKIRNIADGSGINVIVSVDRMEKSQQLSKTALDSVEKEFDIELTTEENNNEPGNVQLPLNFLSFGEIEPDDVKVYIKQDVYKPQANMLKT